MLQVVSLNSVRKIGLFEQVQVMKYLNTGVSYHIYCA